jgi:hypothetical protein
MDSHIQQQPMNGWILRNIKIQNRKLGRQKGKFRLIFNINARVLAVVLVVGSKKT